MKKGLLDEIAERINSYCLSNLHTMEYRGDVYAAVRRLDASDYSVDEWERAAGYILSEPVREFEDQETVRQYLLMKLGD